MEEKNKLQMKHLNISIRGKVQGVFFRLTTKAVADQVGVRGFVVNLKDGSVYIEAEGDDFALDSLLEFCQEGPEGAIVESVEVKEGELKSFSNFEVVKRVQS
ncbi:Acylphosphatase [compost metagenome]